LGVIGKTRLSLILVGAVALAGGIYWTQAQNTPKPPAGQTQAQGGSGAGGAGGNRGGNVNRPPVPVTVDTVQKGPMALRVDAVGTAQPVASVSLKTRVDAQIETIHVADGAIVRAGDKLVKLDSRQIEAQIKQTEANIAKDMAAVEQAERDVARLTDLLNRGSGTQLNVDNARTQLAGARAVLAADQALLENQRVQLSWYTLTAPISGRVGTFNAKAGNIVRAGDNSATGIIATIVQTSPIYVAFSIPQTALPQVREALQSGQGEVRATPQGGQRSATGRISVIDNTIDGATGTIMIRALFENTDDILWPGQLCNVRVTLRSEPDTVSIPRTATQSGQRGNFVYVVENGVARMRAVKVGRFQDGRDVIVEGLQGGETVVSDGALLLTDGARVEIRKGGQQG
jgi:multidrug efflux system membrane fusion protein